MGNVGVVLFVDGKELRMESTPLGKAVIPLSLVEMILISHWDGMAEIAPNRVRMGFVTSVVFVTKISSPPSTW